MYELLKEKNRAKLKLKPEDYQRKQDLLMAQYGLSQKNKKTANLQEVSNQTSIGNLAKTHENYSDYEDFISEESEENFGDFGIFGLD